ncbi:MAG TPA: hypothetical protein VN785_00270, partial [Candidatus Angelobacter sp.]|nr:hypothetical protein [Candidatus Angelobacter sp.]
DLPVLVQIAENIAAIVSAAQGQPGNAQVATQIQAVAATAKTGLETIQALVNSYNAAPAAQKATVLGQIDTALAAVQANLQQILSAARVLNPQLQATITGIITLAEGTLLAIQTLVPSPKVGAAPLAEQPPSPAALKASYNVIVLQGGLAQYEIR